MLTYLGHGIRRYGLTPAASHRRRGWEFQAVIDGSIRCIIPNTKTALKKKHLWVFPPQHLHGWIGKGAESSEIVVFHFPSIPELVDKMIPEDSHLEMSLSEKNCLRLRELAVEGLQYWHRPAAGMTICYEHILMELSLLIFQAHSSRKEHNENTKPRRFVDTAINYYLEQMHENPSLEKISRLANTSPAHLRRLFHEVFQESPKQIFDQLRYQKAIRLLSDVSIKHESISEACGFESASAFSRAFKNRFGVSPSAWQA